MFERREKGEQGRTYLHERTETEYVCPALVYGVVADEDVHEVVHPSCQKADFGGVVQFAEYEVAVAYKPKIIYSSIKK